MGNIYSMPPDTNEKEKIIGGIFTLGQIVWVAGGIIIFVLIILSSFRYLGFFSVILGFPFVVTGFVFALVKVNNFPLPTYLKLKNRFKKKAKYYINKGTERSFEFSEYGAKTDDYISE